MTSYVRPVPKFKFVQYNGDLAALAAAYSEIDPPDFYGPRVYFAQYHNSSSAVVVPNQGRGMDGPPFNVNPGMYLGVRVPDAFASGADLYPFAVNDFNGYEVASED